MSTETKVSTLTFETAMTILNRASQNIISGPNTYKNVTIGFINDEPMYTEKGNAYKIVNLNAITQENYDKAVALIEEDPQGNFVEATRLTMSQNIFENEFDKYSRGSLVTIDVALVDNREKTGKVLGVVAMNRPTAVEAKSGSFFAQFVKPKETAETEAEAEVEAETMKSEDFS